jgi:Leucine-rich repeat (LRR) protein
MIALPEPPNSPPVWTITNSEFAHVASCTNLERLWIGGFRVVLSDDALRSIAELKRLRVLELYGPLVSDAGITHLAGLTSLEELRLDGNNRIGDAALASLKDLTNLRDLYFHGARITDAGIASIARLTALETLTLGNSQVGDGAMATIANFTKLQTLDLQHTNITDVGMARLKGLTSLRWIALIGTNVTSRGFANLAEMTAMTNVYANGTQIDDGALDSMRRMSGLKTLYVPNTGITEAGLLRALPGFPELEWLSINALPATDNIIPTLLGLKKLKFIEMNGTRITAAGEAQLKAAGIARVNK